MRSIFNSGVTRARSMAWVAWFVYVGVASALELGVGTPPAHSRLWLALALGAGGGLFLVRLHPRRIPVLNYHSVSARTEWLQLGSRLSLSLEEFERQLAYLERHGYRTLFISEVSGWLSGETRMKRRARYVALTFDDGYADNWMAALPLLRRYGMKATVFVSTGFIREAAECRPTIESVGFKGASDLDWSGYLTWPELLAMQASGLIEIQSHGHDHARVFTGPDLQGFLGPGRGNVWMLWNQRPETKPEWWRVLASDRSLWGQPVFRQAPALAHRAYRPDAGAVERLMSRAAAQGGTLFDKPDWERRLREEWVRTLREQGDRGGLERTEEYERRLEEDLGKSRQLLASRLGRPVKFLCWPENEFSALGERVARRLGFKATVSNRHQSLNIRGRDEDRIVRVFVGGSVAGFRVACLDYAAFVLELKVFAGWYVLYPLLAVMHQSGKMVHALRRLCRCRRDSLSM